MSVRLLAESGSFLSLDAFFSAVPLYRPCGKLGLLEREGRPLYDAGDMSYVAPFCKSVVFFCLARGIQDPVICIEILCSNSEFSE